MGRKPKELNTEVIDNKKLIEKIIDNNITEVKTEMKEQFPNYFLTKEKIDYFGSGCTQLDCILGGGWAERRIFNIIGDKSTAKTLLVEEACINFLIKHTDGRVVYIETEAAFDRNYAEKIGLIFDQKNIILIENVDTVEKLYNKLVELSGVAEDDEIKNLKKDSKINITPTLVIADSWDGLSDVAEMERDISEASFGGTRTKQSHALFRKLTRKITLANITLGIVSQVKDNIGVTFGNKETIACRHAIEFWSSQRIWLANAGQIKKSIDGVEMVTGNNIKAKNVKNKVGRPHRICDFPMYYDMGINDLEANINWLHEIGKLNTFDFGKYNIEIPKRLSTLMDKCVENEKFSEIRQELSNYSKQCWNEIEEKFHPPYKKYQIKNII